MKLNKSIPASLALAVLLALPALATAAPAPQANGNTNTQPVATLQVGGGVIMVSNQGAPFASGLSNDALYSGERLMVSKNSSATVVYNDGCQQTYDKPGIYTVDSNCKAAGPIVNVRPPNTGTLTTRPIGVWVGAAVATGAVVAKVVGDSRTHCPPVSH